jgi:negative regulator of sigma E activity
MSKEVLSNALDNAASRADWDALLDAMARDDSLKQEWSRSCQARDALAGVNTRAKAEAFTAGVMAAIFAEEATAGVAHPKVVALPSMRARAEPARPKLQPAPRARTWKTWVPVSAAAGALGAVLIFGADRPAFAPANPVAATANATTQAAPVQVAQLSSQSWQPAAAPESNSAPGSPDSDTAALLDDYLVQHSNSTAQQNVSGALHSARFAVQSASYQAGE